MLSYITLGGLSAAIYNEVLQFFVIVAALLPLTLIGLRRVGGVGGLIDRVTDSGRGEELSSWPATDLSGFENPVWSVIGIIFGLGFVLSFGHWTTNFVEVQRAMATNSMSAARATPIIGSFPKIFVPFIVVIPGLIATVPVPEVVEARAAGDPDFDYNNSILLLNRDVLPNGLLGVALACLLAAFMAGMAANISAVNTVFSYDLWQQYVKKDRPDGYYLAVGRWATAGATVAAIGTALIAAGYTSLMGYLQTLFGFFDAPLFATFILGMFWKRMTPTAGCTGLVSGTLAAMVVFALNETGVIDLPGQGTAFVAAGAAFVVDIVGQRGGDLCDRAQARVRAGRTVYSETPRKVRTDPEAHLLPWYRAPVPLAGIALVLVVVLNVIFR